MAVRPSDGSRAARVICKTAIDVEWIVVANDLQVVVCHFYC